MVITNVLNAVSCLIFTFMSHSHVSHHNSLALILKIVLAFFFSQSNTANILSAIGALLALFWDNQVTYLISWCKMQFVSVNLMIPLLVILRVPNLFLSWIYKGLRDITSRSPPCDRLAVLISLGLELEQGQLLIVFSIYTQVFLSCLAVSHLGVFLKRTLVEFLAGAGSDWNALFAGRPLVQFPCLIPSNQSAVGSFWPPPPSEVLAHLASQVTYPPPLGLPIPP